MRALLVLVLLITVAVAGCLGGDDLDDGDPGGPQSGSGKKKIGGEDLRLKPAEETQLEIGLEAVETVRVNDPDWDRPNYTRDSWFLMSTPTSASGEIRSFHWEFPKEALTEEDILLLDMVIPHGELGYGSGLTEGADWLLLVVQERFDRDWREWESHVIETRQGVTRTITRDTLSGDSSSETTVPSSSPTRIRIAYDDELHGDTIHFVLAARGGTGEFGLAFRMIEMGGASENWATFKSSVGGKPPIVPERGPSGTGLYMAEYRDQQVVGEGRRIITTEDAPSPDESDVGSPYASTRNINIQTSTDWAGWSAVRAGYGTTMEAGNMRIAWDVHGNTGEETYILTGNPGGEGVTGLFPPPSIRMTGEGDSASSLVVEATKSGTLGSEELNVLHTSIGMQVEQVTGMPHRDLEVIL